MIKPTWPSGDGECPAPSHAIEIGVDDEIAHDVSQTKPEVNPEFEKRHRGPASSGRRQIRDHGRRERDASGLEYTEE